VKIGAPYPDPAPAAVAIGGQSSRCIGATDRAHTALGDGCGGGCGEQFIGAEATRVIDGLHEDKTFEDTFRSALGGTGILRRTSFGQWCPLCMRLRWASGRGPAKQMTAS
jgi:hypothetical protein